MNLGTEDQLRDGINRKMRPVVLEELLESVSMPGKQPTPAPLSFREIGYGYRTGRSFGYSVLLHQLVLVMIVFSSHYAFVHSVEVVSPQLDKAVPVGRALYLPVLGGGSEGTGEQGGGSGSEQELSSGVRARGRRGFAYPGQQPKVSDPPQATLGIQTILRPPLKNLPLLRRYLPIPDIVQAPPVGPTELPKSVIKVQSEKLAIRPVEKPLQAPKLKVATADLSKAPVLAALDPAMPQALPPPPVPRPSDIPDAPVQRRDDQGLLALNAISPPPDLSTKVPMVEARSLFAITPGDVTVMADPASGAKGGGLPSMAAGSGTRADAASGDAIADTPAGGGRGNRAGGSGSGDGGRYGSGSGSGFNPVGEGSGIGRGKAAGAGTGAATGTTLGSGKGAGSASDTGGFPGITIRGGRYGNGTSESGRPRITARRQTSYGMTITSTASSGGGLPDVGVFQNEKVYTVYLDMRTNDEDPAPSWTLQYAVRQPTAGDPASEGTSSRILGTPTPPYAMLKEIPELSPELTARCAGKLIIASAIMNATGKLEQVSVKQTPDSQLTARLIEALNNWSFQPAQIDGDPVALKILLGIRLIAH
jgi:hypothetical protein